ncbi:MAG: transcription termination/antitermination protein NusG [Deltaproteobacteria bacterium]|nr:transcription termination/antitermination protein NusG [Deltaproteobacteria bacterium]
MEKQWYVIKTYVGFEDRVKALLERKIRETGNRDGFGDILVPTEKIIDRVRGKRQTVERRLFPGYLLVQMIFNDEAWNLVRSVPKVTGFLGQTRTPAVISEEEVAKIIQRVEEGNIAPRPKALFVIGDRVKVVDGPFREFTGTVEAVNPNRSRVRVALSVFGRPTPVDLDFIQVEAA